MPKWTVGTGGSGGSIQQMVIDQQMYPGLLDGLQPSLSFPDSSMQTADCGVLQNFWKSAAGKKWSEEKKTAVAAMRLGTCSSGSVPSCAPSRRRSPTAARSTTRA